MWIVVVSDNTAIINDINENGTSKIPYSTRLEKSMPYVQRRI